MSIDIIICLSFPLIVALARFVILGLIKKQAGRGPQELENAEKRRLKWIQFFKYLIIILSFLFFICFVLYWKYKFREMAYLRYVSSKCIRYMAAGLLFEILSLILLVGRNVKKRVENDRKSAEYIFLQELLMILLLLSDSILLWGNSVGWNDEFLFRQWVSVCIFTVLFPLLHAFSSTKEYRRVLFLNAAAEILMIGMFLMCGMVKSFSMVDEVLLMYPAFFMPITLEAISILEITSKREKVNRIGNRLLLFVPPCVIMLICAFS